MEELRGGHGGDTKGTQRRYREDTGHGGDMEELWGDMDGTRGGHGGDTERT